MENAARFLKNDYKMKKRETYYFDMTRFVPGQDMELGLWSDCDERFALESIGRLRIGRKFKVTITMLD